MKARKEASAGSDVQEISDLQDVRPRRNNMTSKRLHQYVDTINTELRLMPSASEYELMYQARVAADRIRFAIKATEQFRPQSAALREAALQLLDALDRLESAERNCQHRPRRATGTQARNGSSSVSNERNGNIHS